MTGTISNSGTLSGLTGIGVHASTINGAIVDSGNVLATGQGILIDSTKKDHDEPDRHQGHGGYLRRRHQQLGHDLRSAGHRARHVRRPCRHHVQWRHLQFRHHYRFGWLRHPGRSRFDVSERHHQQRPNRRQPVWHRTLRRPTVQRRHRQQRRGHDLGGISGIVISDIQTFSGGIKKCGQDHRLRRRARTSATRRWSSSASTARAAASSIPAQSRPRLASE